jgi:hypothetical protein
LLDFTSDDVMILIAGDDIVLNQNGDVIVEIVIVIDWHIVILRIRDIVLVILHVWQTIIDWDVCIVRHFILNDIIIVHRHVIVHINDVWDRNVIVQHHCVIGGVIIVVKDRIRHESRVILWNGVVIIHDTNVVDVHVLTLPVIKGNQIVDVLVLILVNWLLHISNHVNVVVDWLVHILNVRLVIIIHVQLGHVVILKDRNVSVIQLVHIVRDEVVFVDRVIDIQREVIVSYELDVDVIV